MPRYFCNLHGRAALHWQSPERIVLLLIFAKRKQIDIRSDRIPTRGEIEIHKAWVREGNQVTWLTTLGRDNKALLDPRSRSEGDVRQRLRVRGPTLGPRKYGKSRD